MRSHLIPFLAIISSLFAAPRAHADSLLLSPTPNLGAASGFTLLGTNIGINSNGSVTGNVGVGPHGSLQVDTAGSLTGTAALDNSSLPNATASGVPAPQLHSQNLTSAFSALQTAATDLTANPTWNQILAVLPFPSTINASAPITYVDMIGDVNLQAGSSITFVAPDANDYFVVNITGTLDVGSTASINITGAPINHLFINVDSNDPNVAIAINSGASAHGIFLAANGGAQVEAGGLLRGALLDAGNVQVGSGGAVQPVPLPPAAASALPLLLAATLLRKNRRPLPQSL